ncbi:MAG TPA: hypothetical protein VJW20_12460 [Candidatus Angelobacter sp.]|nr:hypothetical protein [Candidatus Angelobacter sp.]
MSSGSQMRIDIRDTLFGDRPFDKWANHAETGEPWQSFAGAKAALDRGEKDACIAILTEISTRQGLESRHYAQAWHFLRQLGIQPSREKEKELYGVIVEVGMEGGLDIVAAYPDLHARYYNYSGAGVVWEHPDGSLDPQIGKLLQAARAVVAKIGPWTDPRPPAPQRGQVRINMLTPSGLHFGQAPFQALAADALGGPVISAAMALMQV